MLQKLPLDLSTFSLLRKSDYVYIDKTSYAYDLITGGRRYFLSRPRRFGKTLFVSMLKDVLCGNKELFIDLYIAQSNYTWHPHGVIELDLSSLEATTTQELKTGICYLLQEIADHYHLDITVPPSRPDLALRSVVKALHKRFGRVAILIDEYDNPILQVINHYKKAQNIRDAMRRFFAVIKSLDAFIDFVFITGVSSFTKAGLFSGINNLRTITLNERFSGICGYTDLEIHQHLDAYIQAWGTKKSLNPDTLYKQLKDWYNGYRFSDNAQPVYNPFSLMNALDEQAYKNYWFQSGTPSFLIEELKHQYHQNGDQIFDPETFETTEDSLGIFDLGATPLPSLMFQTGYLTITGYNDKKRLFTLGYPNLEVKTSLQKHLLSIFAKLHVGQIELLSSQLQTAFHAVNITEAIEVLKQLFTHVPYQLHIDAEKFYHSLLQIAFSASGIKAQSEYSTSHGRIDLVLELPEIIYIIETKLNESADAALAQIEERKYYEPFTLYHKKIVLLGLAFTRLPKHFDITFALKTMPSS